MTRRAQPFRLDAGGALIDRARRLRFRFNGKTCEGHAGDTLASALMASGVRLIGRSFKYHRPRGIVAAGVDEPNAIVQLDGDDDEPNVRATTLLLRDGLSARSVNCWPAVGFDVGAIVDRFSPAVSGRLLLQDFHGGCPVDGISTARSCGGWPGSAPRRALPAGVRTRSASTTATCWWRGPVRRACRRRWPRRAAEPG